METYDGKGINQDNFVGIWGDPDFNINQEAFYYARVLEVPSKRWSTYDQEKNLEFLSLDPEIPYI